MSYTLTLVDRWHPKKPVAFAAVRAQLLRELASRIRVASGLDVDPFDMTPPIEEAARHQQDLDEARTLLANDAEVQRLLTLYGRLLQFDANVLLPGSQWWRFQRGYSTEEHSPFQLPFYPCSTLLQRIRKLKGIKSLRPPLHYAQVQPHLKLTVDIMHVCLTDHYLFGSEDVLAQDVMRLYEVYCFLSNYKSGEQLTTRLRSAILYSEEVRQRLGVYTPMALYAIARGESPTEAMKQELRHAEQVLVQWKQSQPQHWQNWLQHLKQRRQLRLQRDGEALLFSRCESDIESKWQELIQVRRRHGFSQTNLEMNVALIQTNAEEDALTLQKEIFAEAEEVFFYHIDTACSGGKSVQQVLSRAGDGGSSDQSGSLRAANHLLPSIWDYEDNEDEGGPGHKTHGAMDGERTEFSFGILLTEGLEELSFDVELQHAVEFVFQPTPPAEPMGVPLGSSPYGTLSNNGVPCHVSRSLPEGRSHPDLLRVPSTFGPSSRRGSFLFQETQLRLAVPRWDEEMASAAQEEAAAVAAAMAAEIEQEAYQAAAVVAAAAEAARQIAIPEEPTKFAWHTHRNQHVPNVAVAGDPGARTSVRGSHGKKLFDRRPLFTRQQGREHGTGASGSPAATEQHALVAAAEEQSLSSGDTHSRAAAEGRVGGAVEKPSRTLKKLEEEQVATPEVSVSPHPSAECRRPSPPTFSANASHTSPPNDSEVVPQQQVAGHHEATVVRHQLMGSGVPSYSQSCSPPRLPQPIYSPGATDPALPFRPPRPHIVASSASGAPLPTPAVVVSRPKATAWYSHPRETLGDSAGYNVSWQRTGGRAVSDKAYRLPPFPSPDWSSPSSKNGVPELPGPAEQHAGILQGTETSRLSRLTDVCEHTLPKNVEGLPGTLQQLVL
ncbi:hypothetical protein TGDOM2_230663 [Toxoplasma gondii GAB2-2007-GAL-DOM2]|uniref:Uncharacterized protein n=6 Tax=Toxoplasma gondii TaxID=5811 RepID=S7V2B1_TOXGG|nr:hypothetical protein TGGT1_230663 [Toxoplasma gondii GT1]KFG48317.1 hypothetical protein TGDOM2_230663 [Toxoplasma gondii GAB2-2007-GAL-DOM2]KFG55490.1 hypothetical protein TGFOU_230663 [Toxoplasma gondii FOU]PUA92824.1 hypothetical protein TGBR9_230663 [Toxoplasma gondii TgCATBr9]RQX74822.1 hypothetical protein TGCAST_230663 [Toxoplasma gondii CAST]